jgi:hypothetical protein
MIRHIFVVTRVNRSHYRDMLDGIRLPKVRIGSTNAPAEFYRASGLKR